MESHTDPLTDIHVLILVVVLADSSGVRRLTAVPECTAVLVHIHVLVDVL